MEVEVPYWEGRPGSREVWLPMRGGRGGDGGADFCPGDQASEGLRTPASLAVMAPLALVCFLSA